MKHSNNFPWKESIIVSLVTGIVIYLFTEALKGSYPIVIGSIAALLTFVGLNWLTKQSFWFSVRSQYLSWLPANWLSINQPIIQLVGRENELYQIADRIRKGESSAIIGIFREEKVSILNALQDKTQQEKLMNPISQP